MIRLLDSIHVLFLEIKPIRVQKLESPPLVVAERRFVLVYFQVVDHCLHVHGRLDLLQDLISFRLLDIHDVVIKDLFGLVIFELEIFCVELPDLLVNVNESLVFEILGDVHAKFDVRCQNMNIVRLFASVLGIELLLVL